MSGPYTGHDAAVQFIKTGVYPVGGFDKLVFRPGFCEVCKRAVEYLWAKNAQDQITGGLFDDWVQLSKVRLARAVGVYERGGLPCGYYPKEAPSID